MYPEKFWRRPILTQLAGSERLRVFTASLMNIGAHVPPAQWNNLILAPLTRGLQADRGPRSCWNLLPVASGGRARELAKSRREVALIGEAAGQGDLGEA